MFKIIWVLRVNILCVIIQKHQELIVSAKSTQLNPFNPKYWNSWTWKWNLNRQNQPISPLRKLVVFNDNKVHSFFNLLWYCKIQKIQNLRYISKWVVKRLGCKIIEHSNSAEFLVLTERYRVLQLWDFL